LKRFQDCNKLEKIWRYRWYILIPFQWVWYSSIIPLKIYQDKLENNEIIHTDECHIIRGRLLWKILKGNIQSNMNWYYTFEEVKETIDKLKNK